MHYERIVKQLIESQNTRGYKLMLLEYKEFHGAEPFDIAADKCVLLNEMLDEWSIPRDFVANYCSWDSRFLPVAGLAAIFDEGKTYHCRPLRGPYRFLTLPKEHSGYAKAFENSFQCFAEQHGLENFVIPRIAVERLIEAVPEWGREKSINILSPDSRNESLKTLLGILNGLTQEELWDNRKHLLALVLHKSGLTSEAIFGLLDGKTKIEKNSEYRRIKRWRDDACNFLRGKGFLEE